MQSQEAQRINENLANQVMELRHSLPVQTTEGQRDTAQNERETGRTKSGRRSL